MTEDDKWIRLSNRARRWLLTRSLPSAIGCSTAQACSDLDRFGCPHFEPFVEYLTRYAGVKVSVRNGARQSLFELFSLVEGAKVVKTNRDDNWAIFIGGFHNSHVGTWMMQDGSIYSAFRASQSKIHASRLEIMLEDMAICDAAFERSAVVDIVSTSIAGGGAEIATDSGMNPDVAASDRYIKWWLDGEIGVGIRPSGAISCPVKCRYTLTAFWPRADITCNEQFTSALTRLVEPHMRIYRTATGFERFRETGERSILEKSLGDRVKGHPATSFRIASHQGIRQRLEHKSRASELPLAENNTFHAYLIAARDGFKDLAYKSLAYFIAVGLSSFGHVEAIEEVCKSIPAGEDPGWGGAAWPAQYLGFLLPDFHICPVDDPDRAIQWIRDHQSKLTWNESLGRYLMRRE